MRPALAALLAPLTVAVVLVGAPRAAAADDEGIAIHKVAPGDSLELLAAEYYGDRQHKIYIMIENRLDHPRALQKGERLRIPVSYEVTTGEDDTLATVAETYLGDRRRARFLAEFNGLEEDASLAAGTTVTIPLRVTYRAAAPTSVRALATALFADARKGQLLRDYNFLGGDEIAAGESLIVPIYLRIQPSKRRPPDAESAERAKRRHEITEAARRAVPIARAAWARGDYDMVKRELAGFVPNFSYLDGPLAGEVGVLLGSAYVAFDDPVTARATFAEVLERMPKLALSPREHSPKVREIWKLAGGTVADPAADAP